MILAYDTEWRMALSEERDFPQQEEDLDSAHRVGPVPLDEWREYFIKFYNGIPEGWTPPKFIDPR